MSTATLTSLAMLKVHVDQGSDYLDYLRPFILQILARHRPDPVTDLAVRTHLREDFGLEIPERAIQIVLKRLSRLHPLKKESGVYRITGDLSDPGVHAQKANADRHIKAVVSGLIEFSKGTTKPIGSSDEAVAALLAFLTQFNIPCLKAYLRGTAIPTLVGKHETQIVCVSRYVLHLQDSDPERFESFLIVVQGHMLANALLCPDLHSAPKTYKGVKFYLDTPLLVRLLGIEGEPKKAAITSLITLLLNLGATVATFSHSKQELEGVVKGAAGYIDSPDGRGAIVMEARRNGTTKSDLLVIAGRIDQLLSQAGVSVEKTPRYITDFQIDETAFEGALEDEVSYNNPRAREYDINSVRSIYALRKGTSPSNVEKAKAVLVTSNGGFARAAYQYGQQHEETREVSSVITDFSLANMAWLKAPMGAPSLPATETIAFAYAALQPSQELLGKYLTEIEKLEKKGTITERDHQLLRSSALAQEELMRLTMGDEDALTEETITQTLSRVTAEITREESQKLGAEQAAHRQTQDRLANELAERGQIQQRLFWRCDKRAKQLSWVIAIGIGVLLLVGIVAGLGLTSSTPLLGWILFVCAALVALAGAVDLMVGFSVREMRERLEKQILTWLLKREAAATGLNLGENE
jgi:hypothetical protein